MQITRRVKSSTCCLFAGTAGKVPLNLALLQGRKCINSGETLTLLNKQSSRYNLGNNWNCSDRITLTADFRQESMMPISAERVRQPIILHVHIQIPPAVLLYKWAQSIMGFYTTVASCGEMVSCRPSILLYGCLSVRSQDTIRLSRVFKASTRPKMVLLSSHKSVQREDIPDLRLSGRPRDSNVCCNEDLMVIWSLPNLFTPLLYGKSS